MCWITLLEVPHFSWNTLYQTENTKRFEAHLTFWRIPLFRQCWLPYINPHHTKRIVMTHTSLFALQSKRFSEKHSPRLRLVSNTFGCVRNEFKCHWWYDHWPTANCYSYRWHHYLLVGGSKKGFPYEWLIRVFLLEVTILW